MGIRSTDERRQQARHRLETDANVWIATADREGTPDLASVIPLGHRAADARRWPAVRRQGLRRGHRWDAVTASTSAEVANALVDCTPARLRL